MGQACTNESNQTQNLSQSAQTLKSTVTRSFASLSKEMHNLPYNDEDSFLSVYVSHKDAEMLKNYNSPILAPNKSKQTHSPPKSLIRSRMNQKAKLASQALKKLVKDELDFQGKILALKNLFPNYEKFGPVYYDNGGTFLGHFRFGQKCGFGEFVFVDGSVYIGCWKDGKRNGKGLFLFNNGDAYVGEFVDDFAHGFGKVKIAL